MPPSEKNLQTFIAGVNSLKSMFRKIKSYFPYMKADLVGATQYPTAPYYQYSNPVIFHRQSGLTNHDIDENNETTEWINQNFLIRLHALAESYDLTKSIDDGTPGAAELKLLGMLRNCFAHGSGRYDATRPKHRKTMKELLSLYGPLPSEAERFPIQIDKVCIPIANACEQYAQGQLK